MTGSGAFSIELGAVRLFEAADVSGKLDRRHLHAETKPEIRHLVFAGETRGADLSLNAALAESARDQHAGHVLEVPIDPIHRAFPHRSASDRFRNPGSRPRG